MKFECGKCSNVFEVAGIKESVVTCSKCGSRNSIRESEDIDTSVSTKKPKYKELFIQSASNWLPGQKKAAKFFELSEHKAATIVVLKVKENDSENSQTLYRFVMGDIGSYGKVGEKFTLKIANGSRHQDRIGIIENEIYYRDGVITSINDVGMNDTRNLYVFK